MNERTNKGSKAAFVIVCLANRPKSKGSLYTCIFGNISKLILRTEAVPNCFVLCRGITKVVHGGAAHSLRMILEVVSIIS